MTGDTYKFLQVRLLNFLLNNLLINLIFFLINIQEKKPIQYYSLGDFDIFMSLLVVFLLGFIIYNVINSFSFRELLKRFGYLKIARRDFYECGFRPTTQKPIRLPIQFLLICVFFLLYDIELVFLFPFSSVVDFVGIRDF